MKPGDRIELICMPEDPSPLEPGSRGTVTDVARVCLGGPAYTQVGVKWDSGRTLQLVVPPDVARVIG